MRERLGFLGNEGHQALPEPALGSSSCLLPKQVWPQTPELYLGFGVPSSMGGMAGTPFVTTGSFLSQECWVMLGHHGVTELFWGVSVGPCLGAPQSHQGRVAHGDPTLAMAISGDAGDRLCSSRWQLVQLGWLGLGQSAAQVASQSPGLHCRSSPLPSPQSLSWGPQGGGTEGQWWVVTTLAAPVHASD